VHISQPSLYVTTAIPFVNAQPHLGFALELCQADAIARHARARGHTVHFVTGTDDYSLKNVLAAERANVSTDRFVAAHAARFRQLNTDLRTSIDDFVQTSTHAGHRDAVYALWRACAANGDLYRKTYEGLYCVGCERFADAGETSCSEHAAALERVSEENWFFRLSRYGELLRARIQLDQLRIVSNSAREETLSLLRQPLPDLCVSRSATRARGWGLEVPDDPAQVIWVWFDALTYYLTALGFGAANTQRYEALWEGPGRRIHVLGKGITRFHALVWPAILSSAGINWPSDLLVHGYLTQEGAKISKSGSALDPFPLVQKYGVDAVRYFLLRHIRSTRDGDFSIERLEQAYNAELANGLGNLVDRTLGLLRRADHQTLPPRGNATDATADLQEATNELPTKIDQAVERFALDEALNAIFDLVDRCNRSIDQCAPWALIKRGELDSANAVLTAIVTSLRSIGRELEPFLPETAQRLSEALQPSLPLPAALKLFPRLETA
jgi:methionyl-tRNA synthetase